MLAVDIDGTVAEGFSGYPRYLSDRLQIALDGSLLTIDHLSDFEQLPVVQTYLCDPEHQKRYAEALQAAEHDPELQQQSIPVPYSVESLTTLAERGARMIYVTCRRPESRESTQAWLARHGFPHSEHVFCCRYYHEKYRYACEAADRRESVVLIDDLLETMITAFRYMIRVDERTARGLYKRLTVVGFGYDVVPAFPVKIRFPVLALPSWNLADLEALRAESVYATTPLTSMKISN